MFLFYHLYNLIIYFDCKFFLPYLLDFGIFPLVHQLEMPSQSNGGIHKWDRDWTHSRHTCSFYLKPLFEYNPYLCWKYIWLKFIIYNGIYWIITNNQFNTTPTKLTIMTINSIKNLCITLHWNKWYVIINFLWERLGS